MRLHVVYAHVHALKNGMLLRCQALHLSILSKGQPAHWSVQTCVRILLLHRLKLGEIILELEELGEVVLCGSASQMVVI